MHLRDLTSCVYVALAWMIGLYSLAGQAVKKSGLPAGRTVINAGKRCVGVAVQGACLPYSVLIACIRTFGRAAGPIAEYGMDVAFNFVPDLPLMEEVSISAQYFLSSSSAVHLHIWKLAPARLQGGVLADLSEEDLKETYLQLGLDFQVPKWMWLELHNQVRVAVSEVSRMHKYIPCWLLPKSNHAAAMAFQGTTSTLTVQELIRRAEHASAQRIQRWYRELKRREQYEHNIAAKELRQQGSYVQAYLLQKVFSVSYTHKLGICCIIAMLTISTWNLP